MDEERREWLDGLKAGDRVVVCHNGGVNYELSLISKIGAHGIVAGARTFRRKDGRRSPV